MARGRRSEDFSQEQNPLWYKDAIIYEIHVRAFYDSNGDGIGDLPGLTQKLDYLQDLGVTAIWLLPFYPSPLRDDGYDISDAANVHPDYGTIQDFKTFLKEAHRRGLRVISELVLNHTSDQHPWFQRARRSRPGSSARNFYVWSDNPNKYSEARIIFKDFETSNWTWDPVANAYYWHRFYSHQPDLNFDNPEVKRAVLNLVDFWLGMSLDGLRLDAVPYLYEREGTNCENLPETHAFLKELRRHVDQKFSDRMLLAEANQWPEDAAAYFGAGDECHVAFHFPLMPRLFMAIHMEDRFPILDILAQTPQIPEKCQWALFLRNHDELTLEMVTDEDRDYMYRVYAHDPQARINLGIRRRLAPLLGNNRRKIELMNSLLFSLPGTPVIYYGDEIGMGDNIYLGDRNGVRTPMQWSADRNAGFSRANPQRLYLPVIIDPEYHYEACNVDAQQQNPHSLLWWMKRLIVLRKQFPAFGRGSIEFFRPENQKILAFMRRLGEETVLVIANLSRYVQFAELDLSAYKGMMPVELFGRTHFPRIGDLPYFVTLGPHSFYWFKLERPPVGARVAEEPLPVIAVAGPRDEIFQGKAKQSLESAAASYLKGCRWFGGKARPIRSIQITERVPIPHGSFKAYLAFLDVQYFGASPETYLLPLGFASALEEVQRLSPNAIVAQTKSEEGDGVLYDAFLDARFSKSLLDAIARHRRFKGESGEVLAWPSRAFRGIVGSGEASLEPGPLKREGSNTSVVYGDRLILKLSRRLCEGMNPDLEIGRFITENTRFSAVLPFAGALEYRRGRSEPITLGILHGWIPNQGDAWRYTLDSLGRYFDEAPARNTDEAAPVIPQASLVELAEGEIPESAQELIGSFLESARLLGQRTAELHAALASDDKDPAFAPEPFTALYRRSLYQSMRALAEQALELLEKRLKTLSGKPREHAEKVSALKDEILNRFRLVLDKKITAMRIRCHGDYHLGRVLFTGKDFVIIDFEGEPARSPGERRLKRSPLRDVAGMLRSFHYAPICQLKSRGYRPEDLPSLATWARFWTLWVSVSFLKAYLELARNAIFLPKAHEELSILLDLYALEKAIYELNYELNNRPEWVDIPLRGILEILGTR